MSNKSRLQDNNIDLTKLLSDVQALPGENVKTQLDEQETLISSIETALAGKCAYSANGTFAWRKCQNDTDHTFIGYEVSNVSTTYPDRAVHTDGYWYEKADEGTYAWSKYNYSNSTVGSFVEYVIDESSSAYPDGDVHTDGYWYEHPNLGKYSWEEYSIKNKVVTNPTITVSTATTSSAVITSSYIDLSKVNTEFFKGWVFKFGSTSCTMSSYTSDSNGGYLSSTYGTVNIFIRYYPSVKTISVNSSSVDSGTGISDTFKSGSYSGTITLENEYSANELLGVVVSESSDSFPNNDIYNNKYYSKLPKITTGTFSASGTSDITVSHNLGYTPSRIVIECGVEYWNSTIGYMLWTGGSSAGYYYGNSGAVTAFTATCSLSADENSFTISNVKNGSWSGTYRWYAVK